MCLSWMQSLPNSFITIVYKHLRSFSSVFFFLLPLLPWQFPVLPHLAFSLVTVLAATLSLNAGSAFSIFFPAMDVHLPSFHLFCCSFKPEVSSVITVMLQSWSGVKYYSWAIIFSISYSLFYYLKKPPKERCFKQRPWWLSLIISHVNICT